MIFKFEIKKEGVYRSLLFCSNKMDSEDNLFMEIMNGCSAYNCFDLKIYSELETCG
jgi:hypothetical protein